MSSKTVKFLIKAWIILGFKLYSEVAMSGVHSSSNLMCNFGRTFGSIIFHFLYLAKKDPGGGLVVTAGFFFLLRFLFRFLFAGSSGVPSAEADDDESDELEELFSVGSSEPDVDEVL